MSQPHQLTELNLRNELQKYHQPKISLPSGGEGFNMRSNNSLKAANEKETQLTEHGFVSCPFVNIGVFSLE